MKTIRDLATGLSQSGLEEIYVNGIRSAGNLREGKHELVPSPFTDQVAMTLEAQEFALHQGYRLDPRHPSAGGILSRSGIRWHFVIPPAAPEGPVLCFRKHRMAELSTSQFGNPPAGDSAILTAVRKGSPVLICGETGSGKSSFLHCLLKETDFLKRVLIMEDLAELPLSGPLWTRLLAKTADSSGLGGINVAGLFSQSLRLRPDRLVIGEIRGQDMEWFLQALFSGHQGTLATVHATSQEGLLARFPALENLRNTKTLFTVFMNRGSPPGITSWGFL